MPASACLLTSFILPSPQVRSDHGGDKGLEWTVLVKQVGHSSPLPPAQGARAFPVVDYDVTRHKFHEAVDLTKRPKDPKERHWTPPANARWDFDSDRFARLSDRSLISNPAGEGQVHYATLTIR